MQAKMERDGEVIVVHLQGRVDFESAGPFRETCLQRLADAKVVFNLNRLSFVGSNGITPFVEAITALSEKNQQGICFCGVGSEFRRIFEASDIRNLRIFADENGAKLAFQVPQLNFMPTLGAVGSGSEVES